ncbi:MAG: hypothetical protein COA78_28420 [Blastopirellula sp.]|nr:MAG: hypothetical protein COA78_28420 [Blastopirellula sp.]
MKISRRQFLKKLAVTVPVVAIVPTVLATALPVPKMRHAFQLRGTVTGRAIIYCPPRHGKSFYMSNRLLQQNLYRSVEKQAKFTEAYSQGRIDLDKKAKYHQLVFSDYSKLEDRVIASLIDT